MYVVDFLLQKVVINIIANCKYIRKFTVLYSSSTYTISINRTCYSLIIMTMNRDTRENGDAVAWTAIVVAVLAMVFSWVAFNRSGVDVDQVVEQKFDNALVDFETRYQRLENEVQQRTTEDEVVTPTIVPTTDEESADVGTSSER